MATTTNFGWETPDDTDLVKDGAAAIRTLGQAIDTSMADLEGGTTGQILAKNSNTDMDFVWIANDQGDITGVTAGTGISGGGTSGTVTVTNSMATAITTAGDLIKGTGSGTFDRLGIGSSGQVLTVSAGAPAWATPAAGGGMTLISTTSLSGSSTAVSSIPSTYKSLIVYIVDYTQVTSNGVFSMAVNGSASANNYFNYNTAAGSFNDGQNTTAKLSGGQSVYTGGGESNYNIYIDNYASSTSNKSWMSNGAFYSINSRYDSSLTFGNYTATTAISSLTFATSGGTFTGSVLLYGVN